MTFCDKLHVQHYFQDSYLPELSGHRSVYWIYRTLKFMSQQNLEIPARIDFSLYPNPPFEYFNDATVIDRVFDDLEATAGITIRQHMTQPVS